MSKTDICVIVGASHAGVNCAFALRNEGWTGKIILMDSDPHLPYHRPPLSKTYLSTDGNLESSILKSRDSYGDAQIDLRLGVTITNVDAVKQSVSLDTGEEIKYDKLVLAVGARAFLPAFEGIELAKNLFTLRKASDAQEIRKTFLNLKQKRVVVIGGGYIGLETAASLRKLGAVVTILEREPRVLARITAPQMSTFFTDLHAENGVKIHNNKTVESFIHDGNCNKITCADGSVYDADMIIVGVGIQVNTSLAQKARIEINNGIVVDQSGKTSNANIYSIGDCAVQYNPHYERKLRLESVQNAVDQAKIAAAAICDQDVKNTAVPWFWSDQYDVKLQIMGLSSGFNNVVVRKEKDNPKSFSVWYFLDDILLAVDAVNYAKAYVLGGKFIKSKSKINKANLRNENIDFKPANLLLE